MVAVEIPDTQGATRSDVDVTRYQDDFNDAKASLAEAQRVELEAARHAEEAAIAYQRAQDDLRASQVALDTARTRLARTRSALWNAQTPDTQID